MAEFQGGDGSSGTRRSTIRCGACKFMKRKCTNECIFAPYFGADHGQARFAVVHKVFGANNVSKLLSNVSTNHRHEAVATIYYEAQARQSDQIYGCVSTILSLQQQVEAMQAEVRMMQTELMNRGFTCANAIETTPQQQHQMLQQPNFNVAVQPVYSNNSYAATNNLINMNFNSGFDFTMETVPSSHSLEPFQNPWFSHHEED